MKQPSDEIPNIVIEKSAHFDKFEWDKEQKQPEQMRAEIIEMITNNQFNAYCIDCQKNKSSHANITFGTFICDSCAKLHLELFGMHKHYIKPAFTEFWDPHQLQMAKAGGN